MQLVERPARTSRSRRSGRPSSLRQVEERHAVVLQLRQVHLARPRIRERRLLDRQDVVDLVAATSAARSIQCSVVPHRVRCVDAACLCPRDLRVGPPDVERLHAGGSTVLRRARARPPAGRSRPRAAAASTTRAPARADAIASAYSTAPSPTNTTGASRLRVHRASVDAGSPTVGASISTRRSDANGGASATRYSALKTSRRCASIHARDERARRRRRRAAACASASSAETGDDAPAGARTPAPGSSRCRCAGR